MDEVVWAFVCVRDPVDLILIQLQKSSEDSRCKQKATLSNLSLVISLILPRSHIDKCSFQEE